MEELPQAYLQARLKQLRRLLYLIRLAVAANTQYLGDHSLDTTQDQNGLLLRGY